MARLINDLFKISTSLLGVVNRLPYGLSYMAYSYPLTAVLAVSSSLGYKAVRWIKRDPTPYVAWNDTQGQIDRLAADRFEKLKGALAPAAIFDRRGLPVVDMGLNLVKGLSALHEKGIFILGGTAALALASLSLYECHQFGDGSNPQLSEQCWNQLGLFGKEPVLLSALATAYAVSKGSGIMFILGGISIFGGVFILSSCANGFTSRKFPTFLRNKQVLLEERYQALAEKLTAEWKKMQTSEDPAAKNGLIKKAELLQRRSKLIALALEENFNLSHDESTKTIKPLITASEQIIADSKIKK